MVFVGIVIRVIGVRSSRFDKEDVSPGSSPDGFGNGLGMPLSRKICNQGFGIAVKRIVGLNTVGCIGLGATGIAQAMADTSRNF